MLSSIASWHGASHLNQMRHQYSGCCADVQRVARTYFKTENRLVLTLMPSGKAGAE